MFEIVRKRHWSIAHGKIYTSCSATLLYYGWSMQLLNIKSLNNNAFLSSLLVNIKFKQLDSYVQMFYTRMKDDCHNQCEFSRELSSRRARYINITVRNQNWSNVEIIVTFDELQRKISKLVGMPQQGTFWMFFNVTLTMLAWSKKIIGMNVHF